MDEVTTLRIAYLTAALLGLPCALWCLVMSLVTHRTIKRQGINGGLSVAARGYLRRDRYRAGVLLLISAAGLISLSNSLPLRSVFGLVVLLVIAVWTTHSCWADYQDRRITVERKVRR